MSFRLPESSPFPSTPNSRSLRSHPSTTPAGPPPSYLTNKSTTPGIPPPRSIFGSSFNAANTTFPRNKGSGLRSFAVPESSPPRAYDQYAASQDEDAEFDNPEPQDTSMDLFARQSTFTESVATSPRGLKRSRNGRVQPRHKSNMPAIARGFSDNTKPRQLEEADDVVLRAEYLISRLDTEEQEHQIGESENMITDTITQLSSEWRKHYPPSTKEGAIGPVSDDAAAKASCVATFLFEVHHPYSTDLSRARSLAKPGRSKFRSHQSPSDVVTIPQGLLDWLNLNHNPFPDDFDSVHLHTPSPAAHDSFWDVVYSSILRGKLDRAIRLLKDAGWENAITALEDGSEEPGYTGCQLDTTRATVERCVVIIQNCPAIKHGDWDIKGADWSIFRQRVRAAIKELESLAKSKHDDSDPRSRNAFKRSERGSMSLSTASQKAQSRIPWAIYENLKVVYGHLLGSVDEILLVSQDWLEASIFLTVWWDGDDVDDDSARLNMSRGAMQRSLIGGQQTREVDITPLVAYRKRLHDAYVLITDDPEDSVFSIDTTDAVQVGLACTIEGSVDSTICVLQSLSTPIAAAVVEIAALGGWLPHDRPRNTGLLEQGFSSEDLMVLSHGPGAMHESVGGVSRDQVLLAYADLLSHRNVFKSGDGRCQREGWELAASIFGRLSDATIANKKTSELLDRLDVKEESRVIKILDLCSVLGLSEQARRIAERYADGLVASTTSFGAVLIFYARARAIQKLKDIIAHLTSLCLVHSAAMPPPAQLDERLSSLLAYDRTGISELARVDAAAAKCLAKAVSGYATLRKFYDLRDQDIYDATKGIVPRGPLSRKREAANVLLAVIESASDSIRGGLFDPDIDSLIAADGLLVLLGEALPLTNQSKRLFSEIQLYTLLRIVEDFEACPSRLRERSAGILKTCASARSIAPDLAQILTKSRSDISSNSGFSGSSYDVLANSSMLFSQESQAVGAKAVLRAWDWREGLSGFNLADINAHSVVRLLRVAVAQELGKHWKESD